MADGEVAEAAGDAGGLRAERGAALERAYVHDVYELAGEEPDAPRTPAPGVRDFLAELDTGSLVCDVGCGNGKYLSVNPSVFTLGGDRCSRLAGQARQQGNEVVVCDNLCLPYRDESFDAVLSIAVVHHFATVERRARALRELARVTRIGGRLLLTVWAMEHEGRNFHSQDVLIPWHRPVTLCPPTPPPRRFLSVDNEHNHEPWKSREGSPGSSSLSSPNETCYSFVRRALQRLAGRRSFLPSWSMGSRVPQRVCTRPEPLAADLPIELRRLDDILPPALISQPSDASATKSRSLTDIADVERHSLIRSRSSLPSLGGEDLEITQKPTPSIDIPEPRKKPRLVKQKKSINEDDADEDLDKPTDMKSLVEEMPNFKIHPHRVQSKKPGVFKQTSLNEELMSVERLREKERLRKNIQKQASLNEEYLYQRPGALDSLRDSIFSTSATTAKKFQSLKNGLTSKFKTSTTNIDKVTVFVRMLQSWKNQGPVQEIPTPNSDTNPSATEKPFHERRHSREDGSDSSKDSSLQSDTSVDSEDSFASVIYVPKADGTSDPLSPTPLSPGPTSPRLKVSSVPTSPRMKNSPGLPSPRLKQAFPLIRPPASPSSIQAPVQVNKILVAQYSLKNFSTTTSVCTVPLKPQSKSQPNSPPKSENEEKLLKLEPHVIINRNVAVEVFDNIDPIPPIKEEPETPTDTESTSDLIAEINRDIEEIHKLTAETEQFKPRVILQDIKPYPKITLQTVAELPEIPRFKSKGPNRSPTDTLDSRSAEKKRKERIRQIRDLLNRGIPSNKRQPFPLVRSTCAAEPAAKSHPKLMSLELFNPATDDVDSDSSGVSSPDSIDSVISVVPDELKKIASEKDQLNTEASETTNPEDPRKNSPEPVKNPVDAPCEVTQSLDETHETIIQSSPTCKRKPLDKLENADALTIIQGASSSSSSSNWSLNKLSPGDLRMLEDRSRSHSSNSGSSSSLEKLSPGRRSKDRSPKIGSINNSTWSLNRLSPSRPEGRSIDENLSKTHRSPTRFPYDSVSVSSTESDKSLSKSESFNRIHANEPLVTCKSDIMGKDEEVAEERGQHLTEFAEKLSEKLLHEIDQYSKRINDEDFDLPSSSSSEKSISLRLKREEEDRHTQKILDELSNSLQHLDDPYANKIGAELQYLAKANTDINERNKTIANVHETHETDITKLFPKCGSKMKSKKRSKDLDPIVNKYRELKKAMKVTSDEDVYLNNCANTQYYATKPVEDDKTYDIETKNPDDDSAISSSNGNPEITIDSGAYDTSQSLETGYSLESEMSVDSLCCTTSTDKRSSLKVGQSTDSSDLEKMEISPESMTSRSSASTAPLKSGFSIESSDTSAGSDWSRLKTGSTASLGCASLASLPSCSESSKDRKLIETRSSSEDAGPAPAPGPAASKRPMPHAPLLPSLSDGSDSLPSEGGAVTFHRYYHVFRRGELDQLIDKYVESLHVVSSYYDQASWCVIAEKVQVWTI